MFEVNLTCKVQDRIGRIYDQTYRWMGEGSETNAIKYAKADASLAFKFRYGQDSTMDFSVASVREVERCPTCGGTGVRRTIDGSSYTCVTCKGMRILPIG